MALTLLLLLGGLGALLVGGDALVRGSVALARHWNVPPLLIGLTIVAVGTSSPELAVSVMAARDGYTDIALGNVVGSNVCNIGLILGLVAVLQPLQVQRRLVRREVPILLASSALVIFLLWDDSLDRAEGIVLLVALAFYLGLAFRGGKNLQASDGALPGSGLRTHPAISALLILAGVGGLYFGGGWLVAGAVNVAEAAGMSQALIGVTIIAVGTSLPELVASLMALRSGEADLAIGNVVGSNMFNLLGILGISATGYSVTMGGLAWSDISFMGLMTLVLYPMIVTARRLERWEGMALLAAYACYMVWLIIAR